MTTKVLLTALQDSLRVLSASSILPVWAVLGLVALASDLEVSERLTRDEVVSAIGAHIISEGQVSEIFERER